MNAVPGKAERASWRSRGRGRAPGVASAGETGLGAGTAGRGPRADERAPGWLVFSLLPPHTALQPSLLPSWLLIRTQPQAEARVTPSTRVPAVRARAAACPSKVRIGRACSRGPLPRPPDDRAGFREAEAAAWRAVGPGAVSGERGSSGQLC